MNQLNRELIAAAEHVVLGDADQRVRIGDRLTACKFEIGNQRPFFTHVDVQLGASVGNLHSIEDRQVIEAPLELSQFRVGELGWRSTRQELEQRFTARAVIASNGNDVNLRYPIGRYSVRSRRASPVQRDDQSQRELSEGRSHASK